MGQKLGPQMEKMGRCPFSVATAPMVIEHSRSATININRPYLLLTSQGLKFGQKAWTPGEKMGRYPFVAAAPMVIKFCHSETINRIQRQRQETVYFSWFQV